MSIESQRGGAALWDSEEHYRAVAEAATDAIITIDSDSTIVIVNHAAERIFGYSTEAMIGRLEFQAVLKQVEMVGFQQCSKVA